MEYTLALDVSTERALRTLMCLFLFELLRYRIVEATSRARLVSMPHTLAVLLAFLCVTYALTVGIVEGDYGASVVWSASVGVLVWGVCNAVLMNISTTWSRKMAEKDALAGVANCVFAGLAGANALSVWYLVAAIVVLRVFDMDSDPGLPTGMVLQQVLVAVPIKVTVVDHVHSCTVRLSNTPPVLNVTMENNEVTAVGYAAAVLQAAQLSHPKLALSKVTYANDTLVPSNVSIVDIQRQDALRRLTVT